MSLKRKPFDLFFPFLDIFRMGQFKNTPQTFKPTQLQKHDVKDQNLNSIFLPVYSRASFSHKAIKTRTTKTHATSNLGRALKHIKMGATQTVSEEKCSTLNDLNLPKTPQR